MNQKNQQPCGEEEPKAPTNAMNFSSLCIKHNQKYFSLYIWQENQTVIREYV
jgi:hypothetical protein